MIFSFVVGALKLGGCHDDAREVRSGDKNKLNREP